MQERDYEDDKPSEDPSSGEETNPASGTPPVGDDGVHGQTQVPAADDDVGVPPDEEMNRED